MLQDYFLYKVSQAINSYGEKVVSTEPTTNIRATIFELSSSNDKDNVYGGKVVYNGITDYKGCEIGDLLKRGNDSFRVVSSINSTRFAQLKLVKL